MKLTYNGIEERMFPSLGATLNQGDEIDAPENFSHPDFSSGAKQPTKTNPSAASDLTANEVK
jgi:hypothetical protein